MEPFRYLEKEGLKFPTPEDIADYLQSLPPSERTKEVMGRALEELFSEANQSLGSHRQNSDEECQASVSPSPKSPESSEEPHMLSNAREARADTSDAQTR